MRRHGLVPALNRFLAAAGLAAALSVGGAIASPLAAVEELNLPGESREQMDAWELNRINAADQAFAEAVELKSRRGHDERRARRLLQQASAAYELFLEEFPQAEPSVLAYALYRQARALHMDNKRDSARRIYQDIIEFFPNQVRFACAALFYKGKSQQQDGDNEDAIRTWGAIARDRDYRTQALAAYALVELADYLIETNRADEGAEHLLALVAEFRTRNASAAKSAIDKLLYHFVRRSPNEPALRQLYLDARGFGSGPHRDFQLRTTEQVGEQWDYWRTILDRVNRNGGFNESQIQKRLDYYTYWVGRLGGRLASNDDYQLQRIEFQRRLDGNRDGWVEAVSTQYREHQAGRGYQRTLRFMAVLREHRQEMRAIARDLAWEGMTADQLVESVKYVVSRVGDFEMAAQAIAKVSLEAMPDGPKSSLAKFLGENRDQAPVMGQRALQVAESIGDADLMNMTLLEITQNWPEEEVTLDRKVAYADALRSSEDYAADAMKIKGDILKAAKRYPEAIAAYRAWGDDPAYNYEIAECHFLAGNLGNAVSELELIETSYTDQRGNAAMTIAQYQHRAGEEQSRNATLIRILRNYKNDKGVHSRAHVWAENLGLRFTGSIDE